MVLHKTKDGFVFDDDFGRAIITNSRRYVNAFITFVCYVELRGIKGKSKPLWAIVRMEKLKEHPTENWDEDILLDTLKKYGFKVYELEINRTRTMLSAKMKLGTIIKMPENMNKKDFVALLRDSLLEVMKDVLDSLREEEDERRRYRESYQLDEIHDFIGAMELRAELGELPWEVFSSLEYWWEQYYENQED